MEPPKIQKVEPSSTKFQPLACSPSCRWRSRRGTRVLQSSLERQRHSGAWRLRAAGARVQRDELPRPFAGPRHFSLERACVPVAGKSPPSASAQPGKGSFFSTGPRGRGRASRGCSQQQDKHSTRHEGRRAERRDGSRHATGEAAAGAGPGRALHGLHHGHLRGHAATRDSGSDFTRYLRAPARSQPPDWRSRDLERGSALAASTHPPDSRSSLFSEDRAPPKRRPS